MNVSQVDGDQDGSRASALDGVHGNLPAFGAVLSHARSAGWEPTLNTIGFIGYGILRSEVLQTLNGNGQPA